MCVDVTKLFNVNVVSFRAVDEKSVGFFPACRWFRVIVAILMPELVKHWRFCLVLTCNLGIKGYVVGYF